MGALNTKYRIQAMDDFVFKVVTSYRPKRQSGTSWSSSRVYEPARVGQVRVRVPGFGRFV